MAILSKLKSAAKKVSSAYGNATKQLQAVGKSVGKAVVNTKNTLGASAATALGPVVNARSATGMPSISSDIKSAASSVGNAVKSAGSALGSQYNAVANAVSGAGGSASRSSAQVPNSTSVITKKPVYSGGGSSSGGGTSDGYDGSVYLGGDISGGRNGGNGGGNMANTTPATYETYKGMSGVTQKTYTPGQSLSLEAQAAQANQGNQDIATRRANNQAVIADYEAGADDRRQQAEMAAAQAEQTRQAADAASAAASQMPEEDPQQKQLDAEAKTLERQYRALQRQIEDLTKPSKEYLDALDEETRLTEEEQRVKTGLQSTLRAVSDQPIAQGFITGQGARMQDLANTELDRIAGKRVPLQQRLANIQQQRQAALDVARNAQNRIASRQDTVGNRRFEYQQTRDKEKRQQYQLSAGEQLVDRNGNVIAQGPYKPTAAKTAPKAETMTNEVNQAVNQFRTIMQQNNWRGVNPDAYAEMAQYLQGTYGYKAVEQLKAALKANGMQVDDASFTVAGRDL